jgi:cell division protein ZapA
MTKPASKQIEVQIMGQSYLLACPAGGESSLLDAVERVDTAMCRIRNAGKVKARDRIAVLASLNLAFELSQKEARSLPPAQQPALAPTPAPMPTPANTAAAAVAATTPAGPSPAEMAAALQTQARIQDLVRRLDQALGLASVR